MILGSISCSNTDINFIDTASYPGLTVHSLGQTKYSIQLPQTMRLDEVKGKEGQLGYEIHSINPEIRSSKSHGFIEVKKGNQINGGLYLNDDGKLVDKVKSNILGSNTKWRVFLTGANSYDAICKSRGLTLMVSASSRTDLDSMIAIISTLGSK